jgi:predicted site-specific integrase-resolvase
MASNYVSIERASVESGISARTLRQWVGRGYLPWQWHPQMGGRTVDLEAVQSLVRQLDGKRLTRQFWYGTWRSGDGE